MTWAKFDDRYPWHRKVRPLSDAAFRLDVSSVCWCSENLTDGVIQPEYLALVSDVKRPARAAEELVRQGRWHDDTAGCDTCPTAPPGGHVIHDYLGYNPLRKKVEEDREKRRKAGELGGLASGRSRANAKQSASETRSTSEAPVASSPTNPRTRTRSPSTSSGDIQGGSPDSTTRDTPPLFANRCPRHGNDPQPGPCGDCADARRAADLRAADPPDYRLRVVPPLCGHCDDRWIDTPRGVEHCPRCHPAEVAS